MTYKTDVLLAIGTMLLSAILYHFIGFIMNDPFLLAAEQALAMTMFGLGIMLASAAGHKQLALGLDENELPMTGIPPR